MIEMSKLQSPDSRKLFLRFSFFAALLMSSLAVHAAKKTPDPLPWNAEVSVNLSSTTGHDIDWSGSLFDWSGTGYIEKGYQVAYGDFILVYGASGPSWIDNVQDRKGDYKNRCTGSQYKVRAVARGDAAYSEWVTATTVTGECNTAPPPGGGETFPDYVALGMNAHYSTNTGSCSANAIEYRVLENQTLPDYLAQKYNTDSPQFEDNFDYTRETLKSGLIEKGWKSRYLWGPDTSINNESQLNVDWLGEHGAWTSPFDVVADGDGNSRLIIRAVKAPVDSSAPTKGRGKPKEPLRYHSGVLTTHYNLDLDEGYFEASMRMSPGQGTLSSFFLQTTEYGGQEPEVDIVEYVGQSRANNSDKDATYINALGYNTWDTQYHNYWYRRPSLTRSDHYTNSKSGETPEWCGGERVPASSIDFSKAFHKYSVLVEKSDPDAAVNTGRILYFIDDVLVHSIYQGASTEERCYSNFDDCLRDLPKEPMYLVFDLWTGSDGNYLGYPDGYTEKLMETGEVAMVIDYVKVLSKQQ